MDTDSDKILYKTPHKANYICIQINRRFYFTKGKKMLQSKQRLKNENKNTSVYNGKRLATALPKYKEVKSMKDNIV